MHAEAAWAKTKHPVHIHASRHNVCLNTICPGRVHVMTEAAWRRTNCARPSLPTLLSLTQPARRMCLTTFSKRGCWQMEHGIPSRCLGYQRRHCQWAKFHLALNKNDQVSKWTTELCHPGFPG